MKLIASRPTWQQHGLGNEGIEDTGAGSARCCRGLVRQVGVNTAVERSDVITIKKALIGDASTQGSTGLSNADTFSAGQNNLSLHQRRENQVSDKTLAANKNCITTLH